MVLDPGELVGESLEFLAGLKSWFECQVGFGVALHVHQAALDARARPAGMAGFLHAAKAVGDEHVGPGDAGGQGRVGRRVLLMAPLPVDGPGPSARRSLSGGTSRVPYTCRRP